MVCFQTIAAILLSSSFISLVVASTSLPHRPVGLLPSCTDDESYQSSLGLSCFQHRHLDCGALSQHGLINHEELQRLVASCPVSCNAPSCADEHTRLIGEDNKAPGERTKTFELPPAGQTVHRRGQSSCYPNWPAICQDDASYTNKIGLGCPQMIVFSCDEMHKIGFTEQETYDLINACPCSCGIMCGTWTGPPTEKPIPVPSSTSTFSPTTVPTARLPPLAINPNAFTPTTTPTATNSFSPSNTPTTQPISTFGQTEKTSSITTVFVPQGLEQSPDTNIDGWNSAKISDPLMISLFFVAGAAISLLIIAAYYSNTKKRKLAPKVVAEAGVSNLKPSPDTEEGGEESKKSEQASSVWEADRFVVICDDEYDSKDNNNNDDDDDEGVEIADTSLPRPTSPVKSTLAKMLQEGSMQSNENTIQEASLGASTIYTNDQASLRFEDDYIGEVESYSKATTRSITTEIENDEKSSKTPQISNSHKIASFWRRKRLAQIAKAQGAATEEPKTKNEKKSLHNERTESLLVEAQEEEESVITKVISHRTNNETKSIGGERSDSSTVIIAESGCNALGNCIPANADGTTTSDGLLDVGGIEAEVEQAKDDLQNEMNKLRKDLGLNIGKNKGISEEDTLVLDEQSTFTDSLWTRDTKESTVTRGSARLFDQELNEAKDFFSRGASDFVGFFTGPAQGGCAQDSTKDDTSTMEGSTSYTFSPVKAKRSTQAPLVESTRREAHLDGEKSEDIEVTNKPMAFHTQTRTGHGVRVVKGIQGARSSGILRQARRRHRETVAALDTIGDDVDDDKSDTYTFTPMTRDTTHARGKEGQDKTAASVDPVHSVWDHWKMSQTKRKSFDESSWGATTYADDTVMHEIRQGSGSDECSSCTGRSTQKRSDGSGESSSCTDRNSGEQ